MTAVDGPIALIGKAADALDVGDDGAADDVLRRLEQRPATSAGVEDRLARLFALALRTRMTGDDVGGGNLYAAEESHGLDMIGAFDALARSTPFIRFAYAGANAAIGGVDAEAIHLVDVGVGEGTQWPSLLTQLGARPHPPVVRMTAIDLPAPGADGEARLRAVGERLVVAAREAGVEFSYRGVPLPMEHLGHDHVAGHRNEAVVVNLSLALHHTSTRRQGGSSDRDEFLARLRSFQPALVTLVEPDAEHDELPFRARVDEALGHYGAIFRALDALVDAEEARRVLEEQFFGREIINVVGFEGTARVERQQRHARWIERFRAAGFEPVDLEPRAGEVRAGCDARAPAAVEADRGVLVLSWEATPLLSCSAWRAGG